MTTPQEAMTALRTANRRRREEKRAANRRNWAVSRWHKCWTLRRDRATGGYTHARYVGDSLLEIRLIGLDYRVWIDGQAGPSYPTMDEAKAGLLEAAIERGLV